VAIVFMEDTVNQDFNLIIPFRGAFALAGADDTFYTTCN
jgi:hypothetical protein